MNLHKFLIQEILSLSKDSFSLSSATFFSFSAPSNILSYSNHGSNSSLLLQSYKFFGKIVNRSRNDLSLYAFCYSVKDSLLVVLNHDSFLLLFGTLRCSLPLLSCSQLRNKV
jgi:hypothetical protein